MVSSIETGELNYEGTPKSPGGAQPSEENRWKLERGDIRPEIPDPGNTVLVLQVNAKDDRRDTYSPEFGALMPEAATQTIEQSRYFFDEVFSGLSEDERAEVYVAVFASDSPLVMPSGVKSPHRRAYETAEKVIEGAKTSMATHGVNENQLLNNSSKNQGAPIPVPGLAELRMWENPEFVAKLTDLWGVGGEFWSKYETLGWKRDFSQSQGIKPPREAESQVEIMTRVRDALTDLTVTFARKFHEEHPNGRLIIWVDGMYDNLAPFYKAYVRGVNPGVKFTPIEKGGGLTIKINSEMGTATTKVGDQEFEVPALLRLSPRVRNTKETRPEYS